MVKKIIFATFCFFSSVAMAKPAESYFIKNMGQWESAILYKVDIPGGYAILKNSGIEYVFFDTKALSETHGSAKRSARTGIEHDRLEMSFINASQSLKIQPTKAIETDINFIYGQDASQWTSHVPAYQSITYSSVFENIDFNIRIENEHLKYEYRIKPNGDPNLIKFKYSGQQSLELTPESLLLKTNVNVMKDFQPYTFQEKNKRIAVKSNLKIEKEVLGFSIADYDKSQTLIIDPDLVFSTFSGSKSDNWAHTATYDADGNLIAGGSVFGSSFPVTKDAFQNKPGGVSTAIALETDVVIMKYSPDGTKLLYATYLGGKASEVPHSMIVNSKGELVIFGTTSSANFPVSANAYQKKFGGGTKYIDGTSISFENGSDIFVTVLSKDGSKLVGSTYLGGSGNDGYNQTQDFAKGTYKLGIQNYGDEFRGEVVVDAQDNILIGSVTNSANFPLVNAADKELASFDGVVSKLNSACSQLSYSTFFGGAGFDAIYSLKTNSAGQIFATGITSSANLPSSASALHKTNRGLEDGFVVLLEGSSVKAATYIGTSSTDIAYLLDLDPDGNPVVLGCTLGSYSVSEKVYANSGSGQFIHGLDKDLSKTTFSTVIGSGRSGRVDIVPTAFLVNECGNLYLAGWGGKVNRETGFNTGSSTANLPVTTDAYQKTTTGSNFYFMILGKNAESLLYGTYLGSSGFTNPQLERGDHVDGGTCRFNKQGVIYHVNCACQPSGDIKAYFPVTANAVAIAGGAENCNMASFKFDTEKLVVANKVDKTEGCAPLTLTFENTSTGGKKVEWVVKNQVISANSGKLIYTFNEGGDHEMVMRVYNDQSCTARIDSVVRKIKVIPQPTNVTVRSDTTICSGNIVKLNATGGNSYAWSPANLLNNALVANPTTIKLTESKVFTVEIDNGGVCKAIRTVQVKVDDAKNDFSISKDTTLCSNQKLTLVANTPAAVVWSGIGIEKVLGKSITITTGKNTTSYSATATYPDGCKPQKTANVIIKNDKTDFTASPDVEICTGQKTTISVSSASKNISWIGPGITGSSLDKQLVSPTATTVYTVSAVYPDGCIPEKNIMVLIDKTFQPAFNLAIAEKCGEPNTMTISNLTGGSPNKYIWDWGNGDSTLVKTPLNIYPFKKSGEYTVTLKAVNKLGCVLSTAQKINAPDPITKLPNVISPNGDGKNDVFSVTYKNASLDIYDRYGKMIFSTTNYENSWGPETKAGTYYYLLKTANNTACKGWISVIN